MSRNMLAVCGAMLKCLCLFNSCKVRIHTNCCSSFVIQVLLYWNYDELTATVYSPDYKKGQNNSCASL